MREEILLEFRNVGFWGGRENWSACPEVAKQQVVSRCAMLAWQCSGTRECSPLFLDWRIRIANSPNARTKICLKRQLFPRLNKLNPHMIPGGETISFPEGSLPFSNDGPGNKDLWGEAIRHDKCSTAVICAVKSEVQYFCIVQRNVHIRSRIGSPKILSWRIASSQRSLLPDIACPLTTYSLPAKSRWSFVSSSEQWNCTWWHKSRRWRTLRVSLVPADKGHALQRARSGNERIVVSGLHEHHLGKAFCFNCAKSASTVNPRTFRSKVSYTPTTVQGGGGWGVDWTPSLGFRYYKTRPKRCGISI